MSSSSTSRHEIRIYGSQKLDLDATWRWFINEPSSVAEYSQRLGVLVHKDRSQPPYSSRSRVSPSGGVTESALRTIIGIIPGKPGESDDDQPILTADEKVDHGFGQLLELAIACWEYDCSIAAEFRDFANKVRKRYKTHHPAEFSKGPPTLQHRNPLDWMFISLVFEWHEIFTAMSVRVIIKYDPRGFPVEDNKQLPQDFRGECAFSRDAARWMTLTQSVRRTDLVDEMRKQKTKRTYNYVRDAWMSLYDLENMHGPSMARIFSHFQDHRLKIDLRAPAREDLHEQIDPDNLLGAYETIVGKNDNEAVVLPMHLLPEADVAKLPPRRRGRGGAFSAIARMTIHSGVEASKKIMKNGGGPRSLSSSQGSEQDELWRERQSSMEANANNWRTRNLAGLALSNSKFSELRGKHIYQCVSEIDSNGRR